MTDRDVAGRMADAWVSALPFAVTLCFTVAIGMSGSDILAGQMAVLFWTTRNSWRFACESLASTSR